MPLLSLGPHVFDIEPLNFQTIERSTEVLWPAIARFGNRPGRQMTGYGEDPVTISGVLYPDELGGREELEALRATQAAALPVPMIGWAGGGLAARMFGMVVIQRVSDSQSLINARGLGRKLSFDIEVAPFAGDGKPLGLF